MRIALLGTAAAEGWPGLFCSCRVCSDTRERGGRYVRTRSSALIDGTIKIDFPPDMHTQMVRHNLDLRSLQAILFTHAHDDHFALAELQYAGRAFVNAVFPRPMPLYGPQNVIDRLIERLPPEKYPFRFHAFQPWQTYCFGDYETIPLVAHHDPEKVCFNYIIKDMYGVSLLYASDTGWYDEETWAFLEKQPLDGIVTECTKGPLDDGNSRHMNIPEVIRMKERLTACGSLRPGAHVIATHFSHQGGLTHEELQELLAPAGIAAALDGDEFEITSGE